VTGVAIPSRFRRPLIGSLLAGVVVLSLAGCGDDGQSKASGSSSPPPSVTVATVSRDQITPFSSYVGRVVAIDSVDIKARVEGYLEKRNFDQGGDVKKGDVLYVIEQAPYKAAVDSAEASLMSAQATLENATVSADRYRTLIKKGNVSQASLDEAVATEKRSKASVQEAKAALEQAQLNLSYTTITAPIDGRIGLSTYSVGNLVGPSSDTLTQLINLDPIYVQISVSDRDLLAVRRGDINATAASLVPRLILGDGEKYPQTGKFTFIDNKVDPNTDTVSIRAEFPNPNKILLPDQFVTVQVERDKPESLLVVPQAAVQEDQDGRYVLVVDKDDTVKIQRVVLGQTVGTKWVVDQGLEEGEQVIVEGLQKVRPGIKVKAVAEGTAPTKQADSAEPKS
jgi:membrane fusion protein (multidrug efflux system)